MLRRNMLHHILKPCRAAGKTLSLLPHFLGRAIVPPSCLGCGVLLHEPALCPSCWTALTFISKPFCPKYAVPFSLHIAEGTLSPEAVAHPPPWAQARAAVLFDGLGAELVRGLKYADRHDFAPVMARMMTQAGSDLLSCSDVIVPVPLHWKRQMKRRYNQSGLLAQHTSRISGLRLMPRLLYRARATQSQVGLSREGRQRNLQGAFAVRQQAALQGRRVLLIDDVMTSGATLSAATKALQKAGVAEVNILVFARVSDMIGA